MSERAHIDFETRSALGLGRVGVFAYARHESTAVLCMSWCIGDRPVAIWRPSVPFPPELTIHVECGQTVVAHNAMFERVIWNAVLRERMGLDIPELKASQQSCTMARAYAVSLPGKLEHLAEVLETKSRKDMSGGRLMAKMSAPRELHAAGDMQLDAKSFTHPDAYTMLGNGSVLEWWCDEQQRRQLEEYCAADTEAESEIDALLPALSQAEQEVWELDQRINERGFKLDRAMICQMIAVKHIAKRKLDERMSILTGGQVRATSQVVKLHYWLQNRGIPCRHGLGKEHHEEILTHGEILGDDIAVEALETRRAAAQLTSLAKHEAALRCMGKDDRARGLFIYSKATTGRWAGSIFQPHNLPRLDEDRELPTVRTILQVLDEFGADAEAAYEGVDMLTDGKVLPWLSKCLRPLIVAEKGHRLIGADFSNIEGVINAWLANERWKLDAFKAYYAGVGEDLYKLSYQRAFGLPCDDFYKRQIGKVQELACGYQGSAPAYQGMARNYGLKIPELAGIVQRITPPGAWEQMRKKYEQARNKGSPLLSEFEWTGLSLVVAGWRAANPNIVQSWWEIQSAAVDAVGSPGAIVPCYSGRVRYLSSNGFLWCALPSGRVLAYARPQLVNVRETPLLMNVDGELVEADTVLPSEPLWRPDGTPATEADRLGGRERLQVRYEAQDSLTQEWRPFHLYGGLQCENIVSGTARDALVFAMRSAEAAGYPVVAHVHDEIVTERKIGEGSSGELQKIMSILPPFLTGLPLSAKAWENTRYVK